MTGERSIRSQTASQVAVRRLLALCAAVVAVVLLGAGTLLTSGSRLLDELKVREERFMIANAIQRINARVVSDMTTVAVWDQAYREMRPGGSTAWADAEVGSFYANNRGFDRTLAIDSRNRPFYAWVDLRPADPQRQTQFLADVMPLVQRVRAIEATRGLKRPKTEPTDPSLMETARGVVVSDGVRYLVGVASVRPEGDAPRGAEPANIVISAQQFDARVLYSLQRMGFADARITAAPSRRVAALDIKDVNGRVVGQISWSPGHPGVDALGGVAPALVLGLLAFAATMAILGWQIWRVARRLDRHERAHAAALRDLQVARDRAESANVAKSQFLANMSHEIRTPLNGVLGMAQVLAKADLGAAEREKLHVIHASGETLLGLLNDLLDLSKIEACRMELDAGDFDLEALVEAATRSFAVLAAQKDVGFAVSLSPGAAGVWRGDAGKIRQVLGNLASNAVKFTSAGEVRITVTRTVDGVSCAVSDSGPGIPQDRLNHLFKRFSQVDPTETRKFGGSGLGLAISRELAELMGGSVTVATEEGLGSTFTFATPLQWVGERGTCEVRCEDEAELPPIRVLAAEDNKTNQLLLAAMLEPLGVEVMLAPDGDAAVRAFEADHFDLVLMDIQMPVMNGVDATRAMRAMEVARNVAPTPILALSANVMRHQIEEYMAAGMNGVVAKPIEMATLVGAIERALADVPPVQHAA